MKKISALFIFFMLTSCGNFFKDKPDDISASADASIAGQVEFSEVRTKIFVRYCIECHVQYGAYKFVKQEVTAIQSSVSSNRMPKNAPPLSSELKALLSQWINDGAIDSSQGAPVPDLEVGDLLLPTWDSLQAKIFIPKCVVCHSPNGQAKWIDLTNRKAMTVTLLKHINFNNPEASNLMIRLRDPEEPMPPYSSNIPVLTREEADVVVDWINRGLP